MGVSTKNFMDEMTNLYTGLRACKYFFGIVVVLLQVDEMKNLYTGLRACKYFFGLVVVSL